MPVNLQETKMEFLVDSGADFSFLPQSLWTKHTPSVHPPLPRVVTANGQTVNVRGWLDASFALLGKTYKWRFLCADTLPILGSDFLAHSGLLVDCRNRTLLHAAGVQLSPSPHNNNSLTTTVQILENPGGGVCTIPSSFGDVFTEDLTLTNRDHPVTHRIATNGEVVSSRPYRLPLGKIAEVRALFNDMLARGIIVPSDSPYSSPLVLVTKKDGSIRPCVDFTRLNAITTPDRYPLPRIEDLIHAAKGRYFSTLDLRSGYHQIPMEPCDAQKTAVVTPFGLFHFLRMPFGLRNSAATFQRFMDYAIRDLLGVVVYVDDLLVFGNSREECIWSDTGALLGIRVVRGGLWSQPR